MIDSKLAIHWWKKAVITQGPHFKWPIITDKIIESVNNILINWNISEYEEDEGLMFDFEKNIEKYHWVNYALLNSSWTSSLFSAFFALWLKKWDEVLVPNFTFIATISPLFFFWVKIKLIDCDINTWNINIDDLYDKISLNTKVLVVTHNWGVPVDMDPILNLKEKYWFKIIEDCARAIWSEYKWKKVWTMWDIWCFSFQEKKAVYWWEWWCVITNNKIYYEKMVLLWHYFRWKTDIHISNDSLFKKYSDSWFWLNFSIHPLSAAIAKESFMNLDDTILKRYKSIEYFKRQLILNDIKSISFIDIPSFVSKLSYYHFVCFYNNIFPNLKKEDFVKMLRAEWVDIRITDNKPLNNMNIFKNSSELSIYPNDLDIDNFTWLNSEEYYSKLLIFPPITNKEIFDEYILALKKVELFLNW